MHAPAVAAGLRRLGHDAVRAAEQDDLRGRSDPDLLAWAAAKGRCIVTENARDYRRILQQAKSASQPRPAVLYTSSKSFPRSRDHPGPLIRVLDAWLRAHPAPPPEDWL